MSNNEILKAVVQGNLIAQQQILATQIVIEHLSKLSVSSQSSDKSKPASSIVARVQDHDSLLSVSGAEESDKVQGRSNKFAHLFKSPYL